MEVVVESHIPYIKGVLESCGHRVAYLPPEQINAESVRNADALVVRTRTKVNESLLGGSRVRHVVTATIGTDHIDASWCRNNGIRVDNAPGCNAPAVAQYVLSAIAALRGNPAGLTLGIVGAGHVGGIVDRWTKALGIKTLVCDPPRALAEGTEGFTDMAEIAAEADVITFHTPLDDTTRHLCGDDFLHAVRRKPVIINAARGPVADSGALVRAIADGRIAHAVIDCWEGEPRISRELLGLASVATPHVAGYSAEGKMRATAMAVRALDPTIEMEMPPVADAPTLREITESYDPMADTDALKAAPDAFESLRNNYRYRNEPTA